MAVRVKWEDGTEERYPTAIRIEQETLRAHYQLINDENKYVALIPDYGVRVLIREDETTAVAV